MTQKISLLTLSMKATAAITAERFVDHSGATATAGAYAAGVSNTDAAIGDIFPYDAIGTTVVTAGGAIAVGAAIEVGANGKAVTKTTGVTVARCLQAATADGDRIEVMQIPS